METTSMTVGQQSRGSTIAGLQVLGLFGLFVVLYGLERMFLGFYDEADTLIATVAMGGAAILNFPSMALLIVMIFSPSPQLAANQPLK